MINSTTGKYCKILKKSPGACIFQRPFLGGLFLEGLIYSEGLIYGGKFAFQNMEGNLPFLFSFALYLREIFQVQAPRELIFGGAI